ncbi:hypothetical protein Hanom_Chr17g01561771 [Helianthus anomalus]
MRMIQQRQMLVFSPCSFFVYKTGPFDCIFIGLVSVRMIKQKYLIRKRWRITLRKAASSQT